MILYTEARKVKGRDLAIGDWLDSLGQRGARCIFGIVAGRAPLDGDTPTVEHLKALRCPDIDGEYRTVLFGGGGSETIHVGVDYDVVNPDTMIEDPDPDPVPVYVEYKLLTIDGPLDPGEYRALRNGRFRLACIDCGDLFEVDTMDVLDPTPEHPCYPRSGELDAA